jgi:hypothetical protein
VREWNPDVVVDLVYKLGHVVALLDDQMQFLQRSWCIFELFAAVKGKTELICQYKSGFADRAKEGLEEHPVKSEQAKCSKDADAELINGYIRRLGGEHKYLDEQLTKAILTSNADTR